MEQALQAADYYYYYYRVPTTFGQYWKNMFENHTFFHILK